MLVEFGLGTGDGGPWRRRLGDALPAPAELVRGELAWVITHGMAERVQLLVAHGVDLTSPFDDGTTPTAMAATTGHPELMEYLVAHGAPGLDLDRADVFIAAALADDRVAVGQLLTDLPALADEVRSARPALVTWAAACGQRGAVGLLVGLGFDVNAKGRTDVPSDQPWQTALHAAAERGDVELARTLLRLGADPDLRDKRFDSTALGWARYFGQAALVELLEPVTAAEADGPKARRPGGRLKPAGTGSAPGAGYQDSIRPGSSDRRLITASGSTPSKAGTSLCGISTARMPKLLAPCTSS